MSTLHQPQAHFQPQPDLLPQNHCPLLVLAAGQPSPQSTQCIRYRCAWYDGPARACALVSLAAAARRLP